MCDAAEKGNAGLVRVLIRDEGADPNFRDNYAQQTPLYYAIRSGGPSNCRNNIIDIHKI